MGVIVSLLTTAELHNNNDYLLYSRGWESVFQSEGGKEGEREGGREGGRERGDRDKPRKPFINTLYCLGEQW